MQRAIFASMVCAAIAACGGSSGGGGNPDGGGGGGAGGGGGGGVGGTGGHPTSSVDKVDLLVMVDNSPKQCRDSSTSWSIRRRCRARENRRSVRSRISTSRSSRRALAVTVPISALKAHPISIRHKTITHD